MDFHGYVLHGFDGFAVVFVVICAEVLDKLDTGRLEGFHLLAGELSDQVGWQRARIIGEPIYEWFVSHFDSFFLAFRQFKSATDCRSFVIVIGSYEDFRPNGNEV